VKSLRSTAESNKLANNAAYKAWVESHTPDDVSAANTARRRLVSKYGVRVRAIRDDRQPKRPQVSFALFTKSRWGSGDLNGQPVVEALRSVAQEWKALPPSEKKVRFAVYGKFGSRSRC
jgi:hypothetical protein